MGKIGKCMCVVGLRKGVKEEYDLSSVEAIVLQWGRQCDIVGATEKEKLPIDAVEDLDDCVTCLCNLFTLEEAIDALVSLTQKGLISTEQTETWQEAVAEKSQPWLGNKEELYYLNWSEEQNHDQK